MMIGEALASWNMEQVPLGERVLAHVQAELSRPGSRLFVVGSDGSLLSESCVRSEIFQGRVGGR